MDGILFHEDERLLRNASLVFAIIFSVCWVGLIIMSVPVVVVPFISRKTETSVFEFMEFVLRAMFLAVITGALYWMRFKSKRLNYYLSISEKEIVVNTSELKKYESVSLKGYEVVEERKKLAWMIINFEGDETAFVTTRKLNELKTALEYLLLRNANGKAGAKS